MIRLYPTSEQEMVLIGKVEFSRRTESQPGEERVTSIEGDLRHVWNWLVSQRTTTWEANKAFAIRNGLVGPKPEIPDYKGLEPKASSEAKEAYIGACKVWNAAVAKACKGRPECAYRRFGAGKLSKDYMGVYDRPEEKLVWDYQFLARVVLRVQDRTADTPRPDASSLQALVKNFNRGWAKNCSGLAKGQKPKRFRKSHEPMPMMATSKIRFEFGSFGDRRDKPFYNCQVLFNGLKVRGRLPGVPDGKILEYDRPWVAQLGIIGPTKPIGRVLEGISITKKADGWWASIKQEVPIRQIPDAIPGSVVGIDVGLDCLAAISYGTMGPCTYVDNPREKIYAERIAGRQAMGKPVGRLQQRAAREIRHRIYNRVVKPLATIETIKIERLSGRIGQMGSRMTSSMRMTHRILKERYCTRVREVECAFTSQDCSQCGHRSKESWSYEHGKIGQCPKCGHRENRDGNASRNIACKDPIPLEP